MANFDIASSLCVFSLEFLCMLLSVLLVSFFNKSCFKILVLLLSYVSFYLLIYTYLPKDIKTYINSGIEFRNECYEKYDL